jgi:hypothetical protein
LIVAAVLLAPPLCGAEELALFLGQPRIVGGDRGSPAWSLTYDHELESHIFGRVAYVNEGHFTGHHRDGLAAQLGLRSPEILPGLTFDAGLGPYRYFDTTLAENAEGYANAHGTGILYSAGAQWRRAESDPWSWRLRMDRIHAPHGVDTRLVFVGASYRLEQDATFAQPGAPRGNSARDEVTVFAGATIVNSYESQHSSARSVDYRHAFTPVVRGSVSWINEGDARLIRRNGIVAQGWLEPTILDGRFSLGVGFGPYIAVDHYRGEGRDVLGLLSTTFSYRFARSWNARLTWHRSVSRFDRDTDILLAGIGYRF